MRTPIHSELAGWKLKVIELEAQLAEAERERDELASWALVVKNNMSLALDDVETLFKIQPQNQEDGSYQVDGQCVHGLQVVLANTPAISLAAIQAKAIEDAADVIEAFDGSPLCCTDDFRFHAQGIRQSAKEQGNDQEG